MLITLNYTSSEELGPSKVLGHSQAAITVPKPIAKELHTRPGDAVALGITRGAVLFEKTAPRISEPKEITNAVEAPAEDMGKVGRHKTVDKFLDEGPSFDEPRCKSTN